MSITRAGAAHPFVLATIHEAAFPDGEAWSPAMFAAQLGQQGVVALIDEAGGLIILRCAADEAEILTLAVAPTVRRRGIAAALVRQAIALARQQGAATLFLEVSSANDSAKSLYQRESFAEVGRRTRYYADGSDALVMRRDLADVTRTDRPG